MLNRYLTSSFLAAAVVALPLAFTGCGDSGTTTPTSSTPTNGAGERTGRAVDRAVDRTADATNDAAHRTGAAVDRAADRTGAAVDRAADRTGAAADRATSTWNNPGTGTTTDNRTTASGSGAATRPSNVPGMPSVTGTSTSDMSTADAAAQRLIDNARENLKQNDISKAKTLVAELKQDGMYSKLSATQKANVDALEKQVGAANTGTAQETK